jgi:hypothetical protein
MNHDAISDEKERIKKYHRTRFIIFLVLFLCSGFIYILTTIFGALLAGILGILLGWLVGVGLSITFLVLWIYHLIKLVKRLKTYEYWKI